MVATRQAESREGGPHRVGMNVRQRFRGVALVATTAAAGGAALSGAVATAVVLVVAATVVAGRPFGRMPTRAELDEVVAELDGTRDQQGSSVALADVDAVADVFRRGVSAFVTPLLITVPLTTGAGRPSNMRRFGLLFRDEPAAEVWRQLATRLRMQRFTSTEKKFLRMWRTALAKQVGL